ncbi:AMP-binding protein [Nocardia sp. NPDC004711]
MPESTAIERIREADSFCELFQATAAARANQIALRTSDGAVLITWREYTQRVRHIGAGLAALGVSRGDIVAIMLTNRPEFHLVDTANYHLGATPFSIYNTSSVEQIAYLFSNAENTVVVCEAQFLPKVLEARRDGKVQHVVCVDGDGCRAGEFEAVTGGADQGVHNPARALGARRRRAHPHPETPARPDLGEIRQRDRSALHHESECLI